jgi:hypothetical protein
MPAVTITSKLDRFPDGFPDDTDIRIEWVSRQKRVRNRKTGKVMNKYRERRLAWTGVVTQSITRNFDPGKYVWKAHKSEQDGLENFSEYGEFLVGMTEEQWKKVNSLKPRMQKGVLTTDGCVFQCLWPGCKKKSSSRISALLHESSIHYGVDLLASENPAQDKAAIDVEIKKTQQQMKADKREAQKIN